MLDLQEAMNVRVEPAWREKNYPWTDAIWTETAEAFNHTRWEWWKNGNLTVDIDQIKLEMVDVWHFILSELMMYKEQDYSYYELVSAIANEIRANRPDGFKGNTEGIKVALRSLITASIQPPSENRIVEIISMFSFVLESVGMEWDELYKLYVSKNVLNQFRQANGYKTDTVGYKAIWAKESGKEDNDYLTEFVSTMDIESPAFKTDLVNSLNNKFQDLIEFKNGN
jgi:dimeric dUTPase (all-alpha-NTP-PPase superfamily)